MNDSHWIQECIQLSNRAVMDGHPPIVAIVADHDGLLGWGISGVVDHGEDRSFFWPHAEMLALMRAERRYPARLSAASVYCSLEPCLMCLGAALNSKIDRLIYGYSAHPDGANWIAKQVGQGVKSGDMAFRLPSLNGPLFALEIHAHFLRFLAEYPQHVAADYVRTVIDDKLISKGIPDVSSESFDKYFTLQDMTFGMEPTPLVRELASMLKPGSRILDLGCGDGRDTLFLGHLGHEVEGLDISPVAIQKLNDAAIGLNNGRVVGRVGDVRELGSWLGKFDAVIGVTLLDHIQEIELDKVIKSALRRLNSDGYICFLVHTRRDPGFLAHIEASETAGWVQHFFRPGELNLRLKPWCSVLHYSEWEEEDFDHGPRHSHHFAGFIGKTVLPPSDG